MGFPGHLHICESIECGIFITQQDVILSSATAGTQ